MGNLFVDKERCKGCSFCIASCPKNAISMTCDFNKSGYNYIQVNTEPCILCGICYTVCPDGVFSIDE